MKIEKKRISISLHSLILIISCLFYVWFLTGCPDVLPTVDNKTDNGEKPLHVILFIGDGMGTEHIKAAGIYSTGESVNNGVISTRIPGDGNELVTLLELFKASGKSTGMVTTTYITHATPAAFGAHENSRSNTDAIALDLLYQTMPNLIFGGGGFGMTIQNAENADYTVVIDSTGLEGYQTNAQQAADPLSVKLSGQFGTGNLPYFVDGRDGLPGLPDMVEKAVDILSDNPKGFFLMVEGGRIDHASQGNDILRAITETIELSLTVKLIVEWIEDRNDTLLIVTSDHETGGLAVEENNGIGIVPEVTWISTGYTDSNVFVFAFGPGADAFNRKADETIRNTDIFDIISSYIDK
jgi:alkaline phosphatase